MIVATAGHVDHGKTLLVKTLTGMETDRLEEEKRRGLSINLGFAYRKSADGNTIVFIDVPGHTRFINNMIAGINGIDLGMLVVAADDGLMPQTLEHLNVLRLLGVARFVLVISKIDRVEQARIEEVKTSALNLLEDLPGVEVFEVNSLAQTGTNKLAQFLETAAGNIHAKSSAGYFRMSVDRIFLIKGSGLVATGTVISGSVQEGDSLKIAPQDVSVRVRSLQMQEQGQSKALTGQRCALNISGDIEKDDIERGDWLVAKELCETTSCFEAQVSLLANAPFALKHMSPVKLYIGAKRLPARLSLLEQKTLQAGQSTFARILLERPVQACHGDRFLLRDDSENETLGGGHVLEPFAQAGKRCKAAHLTKLSLMDDDDAAKVLESLVFQQKQIVNIKRFCLSRNIRNDEELASLKLEKHRDDLLILEQDDERFALASDEWQSITQYVLTQADNKKEQIRVDFSKQFAGIDLDLVLRFMQQADLISLSKDKINLPKKEKLLSVQEELLWKKLEEYLQSCDKKVPVVGEIAEKLACKPAEILSLCKTASKQKLLLCVAANRYILAKQAILFAEEVVQLVEAKKEFSVADFKNSVGIGRNFAVEVLECFDKIGFTLRRGSGRVVLSQDRIRLMTET
ncbi:MAG: selenocysteine-specific translation elongation factor [Gammaproteobacteria bacterium]|nr:selenocysteine-specific translation elongation factor [Gammaproteobacteria bacterium]